MKRVYKKSIYTDHDRCFKRFQVYEKIDLPCHKTGMDSIIHISSDINLKDEYYVLKTKTESDEAQLLSNIKLVVEGEIISKVIYTGDNEVQSVHSQHFIIPFSNYIYLKKSYNFESRIKVNPYIEDIYVKKINKRELIVGVLILLNAKHSDLI